MALKDLKSDLSWYGKKSPGPYTPNDNAKDTKFTNDGVPGATVTGYAKNSAYSVSYRQVTAGDSFSINPLDSTKGLSSRKAQGGAGFPFLNDTGFSNTARYSDAVTRLDVANGKAKLSAGTAWRYTANSPIDDQYNKFKVRDEAWNPIGYAKEPFILRGIQENGRTKPRRWGFGLNFDDGLIRGGIVTAAERLAIDTLRLGKWLIKPKGILWMAKQFGLQQSNPTYESALTGTPGVPIAQQHKIFTPINLLANNAGNALGLHFQRHGILPFPTTGRYEMIHKTRNALGAFMSKSVNRLNMIRKEMFSTPLSQVGLPVLTRTAANGPNTLYGIPGTSTLAFPVRYENTRKGFSDLQNLAKLRAGDMNQYFSVATPTLLENVSPTKGNDVLGKSMRGSVKLLDESFLMGQTKESGPPLRGKWKKVTFGGRDYNTFVLTGLNAQLDKHEGIIPGYGAKTKVEARRMTQNDPYFADTRVPRTSVKKSHQGSNAVEKEDSLRKDKKTGGSIKSKATSTTTGNYYSKGLVNPDGSVSANSNASVTNAPSDSETRESTAGGNNIKAVQHYAAMSYGKIAAAAKQRIEGEKSIIDFRKDVLEDNKTAVNWVNKPYDEKGRESDYSKENRIKKYGESDPGPGGRDRSNRFMNNVPDKLNASAWNLGGSNRENKALKDFINFKFYPLGMGKKLKDAKDPIMFRAFIDSLSDSITPSWQSNNDQGRADAKIMLESWERSIDITFKVAALSAMEIQPLYNKMEALALCAYPDYSGTNGFVGRYVKVHIGDLYKNEPMYINNLSFDWDNETPWELDEGLQVPFYTTVTLSLGWIGNMRPDANKTKVFSVRTPSPGSKYRTANNSTNKPNTYKAVT